MFLIVAYSNGAVKSLLYKYKGTLIGAKIIKNVKLNVELGLMENWIALLKSGKDLKMAF